MIPRTIDRYLAKWKNSKQRKVLLLRGARQVGKTFSVREFAKGFSSCIEVNFLESPELKSFFQAGSLDPEVILEKLQAYFGVSLVPGEGLLFLDEIQDCPEALTALRFFHEKMPALHVVAAGSLLEFVLAEIPSFGVGRIDSLFMYPLSIEEFLVAAGHSNLLETIAKASPEKPLDNILHKKAIDLLKTYTIIGGLPEVVYTYFLTRDINQCLSLISNIVLAYEDDFAKYKTRIASEKLRKTLQAVARQAGSKFVYSRINPEGSSVGYDQALELLVQAGLVYKIYRTSANGLPLGAEADSKNFKVIPFDVGFNNSLLGLKPSDLLLQDEISIVNSGALAEIICGIELISHSLPYQRADLYYWKRDKRGSNAEVDYIVQKNSEILPIEVKAGTKGQMQSLYLFLSEKKKGEGIRTSLENFSSFTSPDKKSIVRVVPIYSIGSYANTVK